MIAQTAPPNSVYSAFWITRKIGYRHDEITSVGHPDTKWGAKILRKPCKNALLVRFRGPNIDPERVEDPASIHQSVCPHTHIYQHDEITLLCVGFSTEICDAMRCPEHTCQTSIFKYISRAVSSRKRHVKTRSVAHSTSRARLGGRQSCVCSARWRSVRARDSTIVRRILTAQQGSDLARQVSVVQPASDVCVACSGLPTLGRCPPSSCSPQIRY